MMLKPLAMPDNVPPKSSLIYELVMDGMANDAMSEQLGVTGRGVEAAIRGIRANGFSFNRPPQGRGSIELLLGIGAIVSRHLRPHLDKHGTRVRALTAEEIGKHLGRSPDWVNAVATYHRSVVERAANELRMDGPPEAA